jgi:hypothetical protein
MLSTSRTRALTAIAFALFAVAFGARAALAALPNKSTQTWMVNGPVRAIAQVGDTIWLGGRFTQLREKPVGQAGAVVPVRNVAAISATTGAPIPGLHLPVVTGPSSIVYDFEVAQGQVYVGGRFSAVDGVTRGNLAAINPATGAPVRAFWPKVGVVYALASHAGKLFAGGNFMFAGGQSRMRLAAFALGDGALASAWRPSADGLVRDLTMSRDGASVYAAGHFEHAAGTGQALQLRDSVARFAVGTGALSRWSLGCPCSSEVWGISVEPVGDRVYIGMAGSDWVAAASAVTGAPLWRTDTFGELHDLAVMGDRLVIGGHFSWVAPRPGGGYLCTSSGGNGCIARSKLAALNVNGVLDQAWNPNMTGPYQGVWRLHVDGRRLWAGGEFTEVGGAAQQRIALFVDRVL